ncbi:MAG: UDP-glucose 4-epimerase GalE [Acidobacteriota bacterium]
MAASTGTILVTGGAGYIGSHVAKALAGAGRRVVVYDDLSAGHRAAVRWGPLEVGDVRDSGHLRDVIRRHGVSAVMHFAAWLLVGESTRDPLGYYRNNVEGTLGLLRALVAESVGSLVFSSTAAVFGNPETVPIGEDHPTRPINAYGETKLAVERALPHLERAHGVRSVCLRYFNAAGADGGGEIGEDHAPESHLIPRAIQAASGGDALAVFGTDYPTPDGTCLRDYIHVDDLAQAHLLALDHLERGGPSETFNLGNGRPFSVLDIIRAVERVSGRRVPWIPAPRRPGDPWILCASSDRIRRLLGWVPRRDDLDTIVATAWRWHVAHPLGYEEET